MHFGEDWIDLNVAAAYHHPELSKPAAESIEKNFPPSQPVLEVAESFEFCPKFFSTVEGCQMNPWKLDKDHWKKHSLEKVKFSEAIDAVLQSDPSEDIIFLELRQQNGNHIRQQVPKEKQENVKVMKLTGKDASKEVSEIMNALAHLWERGFQVDWTKLCPDEPDKQEINPALLHLPSLRFNRQKGWVETFANVALSNSTAALSTSTFSGALSEMLEPSKVELVEFSLDKSEHPIVTQHLRHGRPLVPGLVNRHCIFQHQSNDEGPPGQPLSLSLCLRLFLMYPPWNFHYRMGELECVIKWFLAVFLQEMKFLDIAFCRGAFFESVKNHVNN